MPKNPCIEEHAPHLKERFDELVKGGMSEREAGRKAAMEDFAKLSKDLIAFKESIGIKLTKEQKVGYTEPDNSAKVKEITDSYNAKIEEAKKIANEEAKANEVQQPTEVEGTPKEEPIKIESKTEEGTGEPPKPPKEPVEQVGEDKGGNKVGVSHESLTELAKRLKLAEPETGEWHSPEWYAERGRELLKGGADPKEVDNPKNELHDRISIARAHLENLVKEADKIAREKGIDSDEYKAAHKMVNDYANDVVKKLGTKAGQAMTALQGERDIDTDSFTAVRKATEDATGKPLSKEQEAKIKDLTAKNQELKKKADEAEAKLIVETEKAFNEGVEKGKQLSKSDKAKKIADKLREKAKLSKPDSFSAATPASLVWDGAVEAVAKTIEAGGKLADAIESGLKHIRESDWYKGLSDDKKNKAEQDFKQFNNDNSGSNSLEDLQARFLDKKGNKFSVDEAKSIWDYAKETYIDKGVPFRDMIGKVAEDLGLTWRQVSEAITSKKTERISDEMWKKRSEQLKSQHATRNWIEAQNKSLPFKALRKVSAAFRGVSVFGHGGIFIGTHAGMTLFNPSQWKVVIPAFIRGWKFAYGNKAKYERRIEELRNDPNYVKAQRAGLKNNPDNVNTEEFQKSQKFFEKIGGEAGVKGFNAIKVLRQDLFNYHYDRLSEAEKNDPEAVEQIARLVNNATGATNLKLPEWVNEATFAGGMEATRWGKLTRNPLRATAIAIKALVNPEKATTAEKVFAKVWARRVGEQLGTMAGLLIANAALQNTINPNNPTNLTDPNKPDYMKFKFGDLTIDPTSGMRGTAMFMYALGKIPFMEKKQLRGDSPVKYAGKSLAGYARGKLAPLYGTMADFFDNQDFNKNPMPTNIPFTDIQFRQSIKPGAGHHKLNWTEYAWEKAPLPIAHAATEMYTAALDHNGGSLTHKHVVDGIISGVLSGGTGFRIGEYNVEEAEHSPYTKEDKKDPTFKYFLDKGIELPNTALSSENITDTDNMTKKKISDYPIDIQEKYTEKHKEYLKSELSDIKESGIVYIRKFKDANGDVKDEVSLHYKLNSEEKELDKLNDNELEQVLKIAQSKATKKAKKEIFNQ